MANTFMASTKPLFPSSLSFNTTTPTTNSPSSSSYSPRVVVVVSHLPKSIQTPKTISKKTISSSSSSSSSFSLLKSLSVLASTSLALAPPSMAEEFEKAALFDFDLTLPIIAAEFLFLMVALDKVYYSPLGNFMDQRDAAIKEKLNSVKDTSGEVKQLEDQAAAVMRAARAEISAALNAMKKETQVEVEEKLAEGRKKVEAELQEALANLSSRRRRPSNPSILRSLLSAITSSRRLFLFKFFFFFLFSFFFFRREFENCDICKVISDME